jgi:hypothetical protein
MARRNEKGENEAANRAAKDEKSASASAKKI